MQNISVPDNSAEIKRRDRCPYVKGANDGRNIRKVAA
jgi:hypothetical protein